MDLYRSDLELLRICFRNDNAEKELDTSKTSVKILFAVISILTCLGALGVFVKAIGH